MVEINLQNQWLETNKLTGGCHSVGLLICPFHWSIKQGRSNPRWVKWEPQGRWNCSFYLFHYTIYPCTGWWFGTCFMIFHILGISSFPTDFHIFQRGRAKNHQPVLDFLGFWEPTLESFSSMVNLQDSPFAPIPSTAMTQSSWMRPWSAVRVQLAQLPSARSDMAELENWTLDVIYEVVPPSYKP